MKKILVFLCAVTLIFTFIGTASATLIFEDDFNTEHGGVGVLNYVGFINWTVTAGTVDLLGNGYFDCYPSDDGLFVEMDGSTNNAGLMSINTNTLSLDAGDYILTFDLAGNPGSTNREMVTVMVGLGTVFSATYSLPTGQPWQTFTEPFTVDTGSPSVALSFEGLGGDNSGMLLDNISIASVPAAVPEPATMLLIGTGLVGLAGLGRKKFFKKS